MIWNIYVEPKASSTLLKLFPPSPSSPSLFLPFQCDLFLPPLCHGKYMMIINQTKPGKPPVATLIERLKAWKSLSLLLDDILSACFSSKGQSARSLITKPSDLRLWCHHGFLLSQSSSSPALSMQPEQAMRCHRHHKEWFFTAFHNNMTYCNSTEWLLGGFPFWYWNGEGVGVKGRLELFRKFIRFGGGRLP